MPLYDFHCQQCQGDYDALAPYDESGEYPSVECPRCHSKDKVKTPSVFAFNFTNVEGTSRMERFDYRAGHFMEKAKEERRTAEALSHMGADPYHASGWDDTGFNEGITDVERETFTL